MPSLYKQAKKPKGIVRFTRIFKIWKRKAQYDSYEDYEKEKGFHKTFAAKNLIHGGDYYTD